jgi:RNA-binding protein 23/39
VLSPIYVSFFIHPSRVCVQLRVKTVHEKGTARLQQQDSLDEAGGKKSLLRVYMNVHLMIHYQGGNLNAASRQALMQKLARIEPAPTRTPDMYARPP